MRKIGFILLVTAALISAPRTGLWKVIGPGGGGAQFYPTVSPHDGKHVLEACDMTGAYLTEDGGANWRMFNLRGTTRAFVWDPRDAKVIYALGHALFRSVDAGQSWKLVYPPPERVTGVEMSSDHADEEILVDGKPAERMAALAIDPANSKVLYAAIGGTLQVSEDAGATWRKERDFPGRVRRIWAENGALYVAGERTVFVRENGAWTEGAPAANPWVDIVAGPPVIYTISARGGAVSEDGGKTWRAFQLPGTGARFAAVATSLHHPDTAYVAYSQLNLDGANWSGVAKTTDRGRNWQLVWQQGREGAPNVTDSWIAEKLGPHWGDPALNLGVAPNDPDICYLTDLGRTMRTTDGGKTWAAVYAKTAPQGWTSTGLDVTTCYGVHFDPFDQNRIFITYTDIGAVRSDDGGRSWTSTTDGVPRAWRNTTYWMVFDPGVRGRVWGVASGTHDLPRPKMWRTMSPSRYRGGVIRSDDGGRTWRQSNEGMRETAATHILLDPQSPKEARILYVAAFGQGVYKSTDGGATWALKNAGIEASEPFAWRLARDAAGGLYLVVARRSEDGSIGKAGDGALYFSSDGAEHWRRLNLPEGVNGPNGITADPKVAGRLYLSVWCRRGEKPDGSGGIYLTQNGGQTWQHVFSRDQHVYDLTVDPRNSRNLYACGFESSAWRSTDGGKAWQRIRGYNFKWGHRVTPDPRDAKMIYITTYGGSVWHGPAAGDPHAPEDIAGVYAPK